MVTTISQPPDAALTAHLAESTRTLTPVQTFIRVFVGIPEASPGRADIAVGHPQLRPQLVVDK